MNSRTTDRFRKDYRHLPAEVRKAARQAYRHWLADPYRRGLEFKQVHPEKPYYSVRIGLHWRTVGLKTGNTVSWFWIGPHAEYDALLKQL